jgi:exopolyphosphatase/guanosine-5'-triphosphate,3'-diphosphate pyrophosphatase
VTAHKLAAIDIGTNTVLLTVAVARDGELEPLEERATITRLGEGVSRTGELSRDAIDRTLACLEEYARVLGRHGVERTLVVGTSALRDANGGDEFLHRADHVLGTRPVVVSGTLEAALTFDGALSGLDLAGPLLVVDIGGGSTEIVSGARESGRSRASWSRSLDVGSVRLLERHVRHDPPLAEELAAVHADVRNLLAELPGPPAGALLVGVAGTVTTLAALVRGANRHEPGLLHGAQLEGAEVRTWAARLAGLDIASRRQLPGLDRGREDVIPVGAALLVELLDWAKAEQLTVSDRGVRWGLLSRLAAGIEPFRE